MASPVRELLPVPMLEQMGGDVYSGIARASGVLWCGIERAGQQRSGTVLVYCHPSSSVVGHYALESTARLGVDAVGVVTRYAGNDTQVVLENCLLDLGSVVAHLRDLGYERVVLVGNSGGGGLAAYYQSQAEKPFVTSAPGGGAPDLTAAVLPPVDALVMLNAHAGRADLLQGWLDASIVDEDDPYRRDPELDLFAQDLSRPLDREWVAAYRAAQAARMARITASVVDQLDRLERTYGDAVPDLPLRVHGTCADPRFVDLTLDPSDRETGTLWGDPLSANLRPVTLGSFTTLRSWLSQWSREHSHGHGPDRLADVTVPVMVVYGTADKGCFPSMAHALYDASGHPAKRLYAARGVGHYFEGDPTVLQSALAAVTSWVDEVTGERAACASTSCSHP